MSPKEPVIAGFAELKMQVHLPDGTQDGYKISFDPEEELTINQIKPMIAEHYNF
jgi:hypothetical protein